MSSRGDQRDGDDIVLGGLGFRVLGFRATEVRWLEMAWAEYLLGYQKRSFRCVP